MSRVIKKDFQALLEYIENYKLEQILTDESKNVISQYHKKYFAYLVLLGELKYNLEDYSLNGLGGKPFQYIQESCSDIGIAYFNLLNGNYKSAKFLLRSSIETFLKGFNNDEYEGIFEEKSVYVIFEETKSLPFFNDSSNAELLSTIHDIYKRLCETVHTAFEASMENLSALNMFPKFDFNEARIVTDFALQLCGCYITLICLKFNKFYHKIHYENRDVIILGINKNVRKRINNIVD